MNKISLLLKQKYEKISLEYLLDKMSEAKICYLI